MKKNRIDWVAGGLAAGAAAYLLAVRPWHLRWGATKGEVTGPMIGDDVVRNPTFESTRAVTIEASPAEVWPWLVQMGYQRAGFYSYDWIDRALGAVDRPSSEEILPEHQDLKVGDRIPIGRTAAFEVKVLEPERALLLVPEGNEGTNSWAMALYQVDRGHTRLVTRFRSRVEKTPQALLAMLVLDPGVFLMTRKWLLGIKRRAEAAAGKRRIPFRLRSAS